MKKIGKVLYSLLLPLVFQITYLNAQENTLAATFESYEIAQYDSKSLKAESFNKRNEFIQLPLVLGSKYKWNFEMTSQKIFADDYVLKKGNQVIPVQESELPIVLKGYSTHSNEIRATITVNDDFLYGRVETPEGAIYFEPLSSFDPSAAPNQIVIYKASDVKDTPEATCAATDHEHKKQELGVRFEKNTADYRSSPACRQVDLAIANDYNVVQARGSGVADWNAGVMANVNTDYDDAFSDQISFVIVETFLGTSGSPSPWGGTSDANALLSNFASWAGNNFGNHDMGQLWTEDNLSFQGNSSTVGLAYVGNQWGCTGGYHVLEDYTNTAWSLRVLVSHEIGHNFSLSHVGGTGFIMSGSVNNTTAWNSSSVSALNSYINQSNVDCLGACTGEPPTGGGGGNPPDAAANYELLSECPTIIRFNDQSTNNPTSWSWQFQGGSPSSSTQQNPEIEYPGDGDYLVTLTVSNSDGSDTQVYSLGLDGIAVPPNASFTHSTSAFTANFNNNSTVANSYSWDFDDGNSSTAENPSHTYASIGTYEVTLTAENDCGSDTHVRTVIITEDVIAQFSASDNEICEGEEVSYTNLSSSNAETFFWEFENGTPSTSTDENPTVIYTNSGTFNVRLTVTGGGSEDSELKSNLIEVNSTPNASFEATVDGYNVTFSNNTLGGSTYSWDFGDGESSTSTNPSHTYASSGTYTVTLTSQNNCGTDEFSQEITIADEVIAAFSVNEDFGCEGDVFEFINESSGNVTSYFWQFQDGIPSTSTDENPSVSFDSPGRKTVRLTVSNSLYEDLLVKDDYIDIEEAPQVDFAFMVTENTVEFDNNTVSGRTYFWDFGDGNTSIQTFPTHTYDSPGDYTVTLTSENDCHSGEISKVVTIDSDIVARFTASQEEICPGQEVSFTNSSEGEITSYLWEFEGGIPATSTEANPVVTYNLSGVYDVKLTVSDGTTTDEELKPQFIQVLESPQSAFEYEVNGYAVNFTNFSLYSSEYAWDFGDSNTSSQENLIHSYNAPGEYEVSLIASNACFEDESSQLIVIEEILIADFEPSNSEICEGGEITFESTSEGDIQSIFWEFEGGNPSTSTDLNPTIQYESSGDFAATLTITSSFGGVDSKTISNAVSVLASPKANFNYALSELTVEFMNLSENATAVSWDFGDGSTSTEENPTHTFGAEGNYVVTLTIEGECGEDVMEMEVGVFNELLANFMASETSICPGEELELVDLSSGNPTEWVWTIEGEEMISVEEQNPTIIIEEPGIYSVGLIVRNEEEEDSKVIQQYIEVMPMADANFTYEQSELEISFVQQSDNGMSFLWNFGDGTTSDEANPTHSYTEEGTYLVTLTVLNDCGSEDFQKEIGVYNRLLAGFESDQTDICTGTEIQFEDRSSGNALKWSWSFPGGTPSISSEPNPIVTYDAPGNYDVMLTVSSDSEEITETKSRYIRVSSAVEADFEYDVDKNKVSIISDIANADQFSWNFESTEANPVFEFEEEKAYEIILTASNSCSEKEVVKVVDLYEEADIYANFVINNNSYCLGDPIEFIDLSSNDVTEWKWKFPGGSPASSNEKNPIVTYEEFGKYDVELTVTNGFNVRTINFEDYVEVLELPTAKFEIIQENNLIDIVNKATSFTELYWYVNNVFMGDDLQNFEFDKNGQYIIKQIASNACSESIYIDTVEVNVFPTAGFSVTQTKGCAPFTVEFESKSTDNTSELIWLFEGAEVEEVTGLSASATYNEPGQYGITVIATNEFGSDTIKLQRVIEVIEDPVVYFEYIINGFEVDFSAFVGDYDKLVWDFGDGFTGGEANMTHTYQKEGNYLVTITSYIGNCISEYELEITILSSSVDEEYVEQLIKVYPNPTSNFVKISLEGVEDVTRIGLIDPLGRQILTKNLDPYQHAVVLEELGQLPDGQYYISIVRKGKQPIYKKLTVMK